MCYIQWCFVSRGQVAIWGGEGGLLVDCVFDGVGTVESGVLVLRQWLMWMYVDCGVAFVGDLDDVMPWVVCCAKAETVVKVALWDGE